MEVGQGLFGGYEAQIGNFLRVSATGEIGPGWSARKRLTHKQGNNNNNNILFLQENYFQTEVQIS